MMLNIFRYKNIARLFIAICFALLVLLEIPSDALAESCKGFWGNEIELTDSLKKVLISKIPIPVSSSDISGAASFRNMKVSFNKKVGSTLETGNELNMLNLEGATGYALVEFRVNTSLNGIPVIKDYLESKYLSAASFDVPFADALLVLKDSTGKEVATHAFELRGGSNEITICEFGHFKKEARSIEVKVKSFTGNLSINHSF